VALFVARTHNAIILLPVKAVNYNSHCHKHSSIQWRFYGGLIGLSPPAMSVAPQTVEPSMGAKSGTQCCDLSMQL